MAGPITWKNVTPVDLSGEVNAFLRAGQQVGEGIKGIGEATNQFVDDRVQAQTDMMTAELLSAGDDMNAANQIIQKYSQGNFAPTTDSIQRAQDELRSIAQYNDQMRTNDLNRARTQQSIDLATFGENRARQQAGFDAAAELRRQAEENRSVERFGWDRTNQEATEARNADADRDRDLANERNILRKKEEQRADVAAEQQVANKTAYTDLVKQLNTTKDPAQRTQLLTQAQRLADENLWSKELTGKLDEFTVKAAEQAEFTWQDAAQAVVPNWTPGGGATPATTMTNSQIDNMITRASEKFRADNPYLSDAAATKILERKFKTSGLSEYIKKQKTANDRTTARIEATADFADNVAQRGAVQAIQNEVKTLPKFQNLTAEEWGNFTIQFKGLEDNLRTKVPNADERAAIMLKIAGDAWFSDWGLNEWHVPGFSTLGMDPAVDDISGTDLDELIQKYSSDK
jgi:hypothetical protein